ncbi:MAG: Uma2 family endonuclease [Gemmataceae bacterium]
MSLDLEPAIEATDTPPPAVPVEDRKGYELVDGVWKEKSMGNKAATVSSNLHAVLGPFVRLHRLGRVLLSEGRYCMLPTRAGLLRKPDLSFIAAGRLPNDIIPDKDLTLAPDLAVEVVSPNDLAVEVETKLDEYLTAGVRLAWVVYVPTRSVVAFRPDGTAVRRTAADTLDGADVLPGFAVPVAELFDGV